ncbi:unnamed protein product, partial [Chrysoparadoxa australica]
MLNNWFHSRGSLLADEMGLGKTLQTAVFLSELVHTYKRPGPFLVVVPLSTLPHWQREIIGWTGLNAVTYYGTRENRAEIVKYEMEFQSDHGKKNSDKAKVSGGGQL